MKEWEMLRSAVTAVQPFTEGEWEAFSLPWKTISVGRKQTVTIAGEKERYLYFVLEGVQRVFYLDDEGREATLVFTYAPSFGGVIDSLLLQQPSKYYYETLSASRFLRISFADLSLLMQTHAVVESFVCKALTLSLSGLLERLVELQAFSSEEKFRKLLQRSPHILQLVPQKYLANYVGIDATNFSKLMHSVRI
ncbi:MAG TPA: cyclic nucleotide-binding domain-containing protein [Flavisolibacter sp.]|nr:cyclic nucleotide-binding domain-containing protein [Flavisolibacter sp.]